MTPIRRTQKQIVVFLLSCLLSGTAFGHARFKLNGLFKPRTNDPGLKTAPCGGAARANTSTTLTPGQQVTVEWEETVDHPGFFRLSFSPANDVGFENNVIADNILDTQNDGKTPHFYSKQITLPNQSCTACTLQLIQVMTDVPAAPTNYYSCSDIQLLAAATPPNDVLNLKILPADKQALLSWQNPNSNVASVIILQDSKPIAATLTPNQSYKVGDLVGTARIVYIGNGTSFTATGLQAGSAVYFKLITQSAQGLFSSGSTKDAIIPQAATNLAPTASFTIKQKNKTVTSVKTDAGLVVVNLAVSDANPSDTFAIDWSRSDNRLVDEDTSELTLSFDPSNLAAGRYDIIAVVTDNGIPPASATAQRSLLVNAAPAPAATAPATPTNPVTPATPTKPTTGTTASAKSSTGSFPAEFLLVAFIAFLRRRGKTTRHT